MSDNALGRTEELPADSGFARAKRLRLIGLLVLSTVFGAIEQLQEINDFDGTFFIIAGTIGVVMLVVSWCLLDARERGYTIPKLLLVLIVLFGAIGLPLYLIRTRGVRGLWSSLLALLFLGLMVIFDLIGSMTISIINGGE